MQPDCCSVRLMRLVAFALLLLSGSAFAACPAYPQFPTTDCTGWQHTGVTLESTGGMYISTPNTTIDSKLINGDVIIAANNVTITRSQINGRLDAGFSHTGHVFTDVKIDGQNTTLSCLNGYGWTGTRLQIVGCGQGVWGGFFTLIDSYIADLYGAGNVHSEAVLGLNGGITIRHSFLKGEYRAEGTWTDPSAGMSSAVSFYTHDGSWGPIDGITFEYNFLDTGESGRSRGGICLYPGGCTGAGCYPGNDPVTNTRWVGNVWARNSSGICGFSGPVASACPSCASGGLDNNGTNCWSNNAYDDGTPITLGSLPACSGVNPIPNAPTGVSVSVQ